MRKKRVVKAHGAHETYDKKEIVDICESCPLAVCRPEGCKRFKEEKQKLKRKGA